MLYEDILYLYKMSSLENEELNFWCRAPEKDSSFFGSSIKMVNFDNYEAALGTISEQGSDMITISDGSIICFYYETNESNVISSFSICFLPALSSEVLFEPDSFSVGDYYLRIDYSPTCHREFFHTKIHTHFSLSKNNLRFPVNRIVMPSEFLVFVFKHIYCKDSEKITQLEKYTARYKDFFGSELTKKEKEGFFIAN